MEKVLKWETSGILFIILVGSLLHFVYALSGYWMPLAIIAAVNESVWEHLKLGIWPPLFFAVIEYKWIRKEINNFLIAKTLASYVIPLSIVLLFYGYTAVTGENFLFMDIAIFIIAVVLGQIASFTILTTKTLGKTWFILAVTGLFTLMILTPLFTFAPPRHPLFRDSLTGTYGL